MSNELTTISNNTLAIWDDIDNVRNQFAPTLTDMEFKFFVSLGRGLGANPFKREIWAVKYDVNKPASIFCGRDFYRKKAEEQADYNGHVSDAVYENDKFTVINGLPQHEYTFANRGKLIGAYCVVYRKNIDKPFFVFAELVEYNKGFSNWKTMPATMIKKVAEAQALRGAYQGVFEGTYDESENWKETKAIELKPIADQEPLPEEPFPRENIAVPPLPKAGITQENDPMKYDYIEEISEKSGTGKNGKPYKRYGIKISGIWYNTFSDTNAAMASDIKKNGEAVKFTFEKKGDFNDLLTIERA